jgi:hypothetical protein
MYKIIGADGKEYGPISAEQLRQWIAEGRANAQTKVLSEGANDWRPLGEFPEFGLGPSLTSPPVSMMPQAFPSAPNPARKNNPMAITALIMGILAITCGLCCYGLPFNILGIIFSLVGLSQIKQSQEQGRGMAIAGLILSVLSIMLSIALFLLGMALNGSDLLRRIQNM